jgi:recombination protein RecT
MSSALPIKLFVEKQNVKDRLQSILGQRAPQFAAAIVQVVNRSNALQNCSSESVVGAAITAAVLDLSIDPNLGEAFIIPYGPQASFQLGYIGLTQLALRSGQYKRLGWQVVHEGELRHYDELTGELEIKKDDRTSDTVIGYAAKFVLVNGFERGEFWTADQIKAHATRFSQAFKKGKQDSPWITDPEKMALKTVLKHLLRVWGPKSIAMQKAFASDEKVFRDIKDLDNSIDVETAKEEEQTQAEEKKQAVKETVANVASTAQPQQQTEPPTGEDNSKASPPSQDPGVLPPAVAELISMLEGISFDEFRTFARLSCQKDLDDVPGYEDLPAQFCVDVMTKWPKQLGKFIKVYRK